VRAGQVHPGARWELRQCHGLDIPEGRDQVRDDPSARAAHEGDVEAAVQLREGFPFFPRRGDPVDQPVEFLIASTPERGTDLPGLTQVDSSPHLDHLAERLLVLPGELTVLVTLGDPTDNHFMEEIQGLSAFGGIPGFIELTLWPNRVVCDRIEAIAAHEFHHNVRYGQGGIVWDPMAVALRDTEHVERQRSVYAVRRALLLEARGILLLSPAMRKDALLHTRDEDDGKLQALGGVHGHHRDGARRRKRHAAADN